MQSFSVPVKEIHAARYIKDCQKDKPSNFSLHSALMKKWSQQPRENVDLLDTRLMTSFPGQPG